MRIYGAIGDCGWRVLVLKRLVWLEWVAGGGGVGVWGGGGIRV